MRIVLIAVAGIIFSTYAAAQAGINVTGPGSLGAGSITNSTVIIGLNKEQFESALKPNPVEKTRERRSGAGAQRDVPVGSTSTDPVSQLAAQADVARRNKDWTRADSLLGQAEVLALASAARFRSQWLESNRQAANLIASRGRIALARLDRREGALLLMRAFEWRADDASVESFWWLVEASDALMIEGDSDQAMHALRTAHDAATLRAQGAVPWQRALATAHEKIGNIHKIQGNLDEASKSFERSLDIRRGLGDPEVKPRSEIRYLNIAEMPYRFDANWSDLAIRVVNDGRKSSSSDEDKLLVEDLESLRDLSIVLNKTGETQLASGNLSGALNSFRRSLEIRTSLVSSDPKNRLWQRDLAFVFNKIGSVQAAQGDIGAALRNFQASFAISERLAASDPSNTEWQRDLSVSYERIGNVQEAMGDLAAALKSFQASLAIAERLAASDPRNTELRRDVFVSYVRIGDLREAQGDTASALKTFQKSLAIAQLLVASDPRNTQWQRDLSGLYDRIGAVQMSQGNMAVALKSFQVSLSIAERLVASDPRNTEWQRDLSVSNDRIGSVHAAQGDLAAALRSLQASLYLRKRLAASDRSNAQWERDLSISYDRIGQLQSAQGDTAAALESLRASLTIAKGLAARDPANTQWMRDLSTRYGDIGSLQAEQGDNAAAAKSFQAGLGIAKRLAESDPSNSQWQRDVAASYWKLASLGEAIGSLEERRALLQKALDILTTLRNRGQLPESSTGWIKVIEDALQKLK